MLKKIVAVAGPTASGKTALALKIAAGLEAHGCGNSKAVH